jgi:hypothetical protein
MLGPIVSIFSLVRPLELDTAGPAQLQQAFFDTWDSVLHTFRKAVFKEASTKARSSAWSNPFARLVRGGPHEPGMHMKVDEGKYSIAELIDWYQSKTLVPNKEYQRGSGLWARCLPREQQ